MIVCVCMHISLKKQNSQNGRSSKSSLVRFSDSPPSPLRPPAISSIPPPSVTSLTWVVRGLPLPLGRPLLLLMLLLRRQPSCCGGPSPRVVVPAKGPHDPCRPAKGWGMAGAAPCMAKGPKRESTRAPAPVEDACGGTVVLSAWGGRQGMRDGMAPS